MTSLQVINHIASRPEYQTIVIDDEDKTPMQAIEYLSYDIGENDNWRINGSLEPNTLIVYPN